MVCWSFLVAQSYISSVVVFFPATWEPVFKFCDGSTWSVIYTVGLARIQFLLKLGNNRLFYIMFCCCSCLFSILCVLFWELFCFLLPVEDKRNYLHCLHLFFLACPLKGVWDVRLWLRSVVVWQWCLVLFAWPHSCLDRLRNVSWTSALCHEVA